MMNDVVTERPSFPPKTIERIALPENRRLEVEAKLRGLREKLGPDADSEDKLRGRGQSAGDRYTVYLLKGLLSKGEINVLEVSGQMLDILTPDHYDSGYFEEACLDVYRTTNPNSAELAAQIRFPQTHLGAKTA